MANVKFLTGSKDKIDAQISSGVADAGDVIFTSDTDEIVFLNPAVEKKVMQSRTQKAYTLNGTNLGGLAEGAVIAEGTSIDDLLELITRKVVPATYERPLITLVNNGQKTEYEIGETVSETFQSQFTQNDAGALTAHYILKNGEQIYTGGDASAVIGCEYNFQITEPIITFESQAMHKAGEIKNNNFNEASPEGAIAAGIITSQSIVYSGYRNLFFGTGIGDIFDFTSDNIRALPGVISNPETDMEFSIDVPAGEQYVVFAYPSSLGEVKNITYVQANDTNMAPNFDVSKVEVEGANGFNAVEYNVYTYKTAVPIAAQITFKVIL